MKKRLEEIERNMRDILKEVNETSKKKYRNIEISLWPTRSEPFKINFWDGQDHAPISQFDYAGTSEELIKWITKRKILFQKFNNVLKEEKK